MKNLIIIFILLIGISANSKTFNVKGIQKYCETDRYDSRERNLTITKKDNNIVKSVETRFGEFKIKGLTEGLYIFQFQNAYGQLISKEVELTNDHDQIIICVDEFKETNEETIISNLKESDKLTIEITSSGCFHFRSEQIKVFFEKGQLIAELYVSNNLIKRKKINPKSLEYLIDFEKKVRQMKNNLGGCTSSDLYVFSLNNESGFSVNDDSCDWSGSFHLKKDIFNYKN